MEDFRIDVSVDSGMHARSITLTLEPFSLIGATTRAGLVSGPLRSRFGMTHHLEFYSDEDLHTIARRSANLLQMRCNDDATLALPARRSRGKPRIVNRLLRRVRDYAQVHNNGMVSAEIVEEALTLEGIDRLGLDPLDRKFLKVLGTTFQGGPAGIEAIAATMSEESDTLEGVVEPYLLQCGFLTRTRRGRQLTQHGASHVGLTLNNIPTEAPLFED
jgi:Holliday junction DNA helicase RuvB